eukprot:m.272103 g.272103  ORF g.272103 m.272103 type:complete len:949 (+) comp19746_c0_seq54:206-3052(+)
MDAHKRRGCRECKRAVCVCSSTSSRGRSHSPRHRRKQQSEDSYARERSSAHTEDDDTSAQGASSLHKQRQVGTIEDDHLLTPYMQGDGHRDSSPRRRGQGKHGSPHRSKSPKGSHGHRRHSKSPHQRGHGRSRSKSPIHAHAGGGSSKQYDDTTGGPSGTSSGEKKPRMRTAREVVNRILTDANLHPGDFFVGYDDRFKGAIEKDFESFNWSSYTSVDPDADNAVPEHRILYFKYHARTVWDKATRKDDMFGSTGGKKITDIIAGARMHVNNTVTSSHTEDNGGWETVTKKKFRGRPKGGAQAGKAPRSSGTRQQRENASSREYQSAVCILPPEDVWQCFQNFRRRRDHLVNRWPPHCAVLYPFVEQAQIATATETLASVAASMQPLRASVTKVDAFPSVEDRPQTMYATVAAASCDNAASESEPFQRLHESLQVHFPEAPSFASTKIPHITLGQWAGYKGAQVERMQDKWTPVDFDVDCLYVLERTSVDDPFHITAVVPLGVHTKPRYLDWMYIPMPKCAFVDKATKTLMSMVPRANSNTEVVTAVDAGRKTDEKGGQKQHDNGQSCRAACVCGNTSASGCAAAALEPALKHQSLSPSSADFAARSMRKMTLDPHAVTKPSPGASALRAKFQNITEGTGTNPEEEVLRRNVRNASETSMASVTIDVSEDAVESLTSKATLHSTKAAGETLAADKNSGGQSASPTKRGSRPLWHLGVSCDWLAGFATKHNLWETPTWQVVADVIKPKTKLLKCRFVELSTEIEDDEIGPPDVLISHSWANNFGDLVSAAMLNSTPGRKVWLDILTVHQNDHKAMAADLMQLNEVINHATSGSIIIINPEAALVNANTNPLMRIWCVYEIWWTILKSKPLTMRIGQVGSAAGKCREGSPAFWRKFDEEHNKEIIQDLVEKLGGCPAIVDNADAKRRHVGSLDMALCCIDVEHRGGGSMS